MKVLSVRQPWAYLIVAGYKDVENRTWRTSYRGPLLIHASLGKDPEDFMPRQREYIESAGIVIPEDLPRGAIVGSVNLSGVAEAGDTTSPWFEGPYGFKMEDAVEFEQPIQCRGQLGIRDVSDSLMARVSKTLIK
jgi:hypothetical protein